jgi:alanine racemase
MKEQSFNRVFIDQAALRHNYRVVKQLTSGGRPVMAMVKADAYGHGMVIGARAFAAAGCTTFGVAELREGTLLRQAGISGEIYVTLGFFAEEAEAILRYDLIPVVYDLATARLLAGMATAASKEVAVHLKVDTGMGRLGLLPDELGPFLDAVQALPGLRVAGLMSHFPEADIAASASTLHATAVFAELCRLAKSRFSGICHIANSGAVLNFPASHGDMVRSGIALYGYHPAGPSGGWNGEALRPAMSMRTRVVQVKTLPAGSGISYGHTYRTTQPMRVAVLPIGYEDGFSRALSNRAEVLIGGRRAPVRGRVCMNMCMVDVTAIDEVCAGDEVVVLGRQGGESITADDLAQWMGTISYEVLCLLGNNNQREVAEEGQ